MHFIPQVAYQSNQFKAAKKQKVPTLKMLATSAVSLTTCINCTGQLMNDIINCDEVSYNYEPMPMQSACEWEKNFSEALLRSEISEKTDGYLCEQWDRCKNGIASQSMYLLRYISADIGYVRAVCTKHKAMCACHVCALIDINTDCVRIKLRQHHVEVSKALVHKHSMPKMSYPFYLL